MPKTNSLEFEIRLRAEIGTEKGALKVEGIERVEHRKGWYVRARCACGTLIHVASRNWYYKPPQSCTRCAARRRNAANRTKHALRARRSTALSPDQKEAVRLMMTGRRFPLAGDCTTTYEDCMREAIEMAQQFSLEDIRAWFDDRSGSA